MLLKPVPELALGEVYVDTREVAHAEEHDEEPADNDPNGDDHG